MSNGSLARRFVRVSQGMRTHQYVCRSALDLPLLSNIDEIGTVLYVLTLVSFLPLCNLENALPLFIIIAGFSTARTCSTPLVHVQPK